MTNIQQNLIQLLKDEVKPALGCTEPGAVALGCAMAKELIGDDKVINCVVEVSPNIYKNGMCVGIPGTNGEIGLPISAALGITGGDSKLGLNALESSTAEALSYAHELLNQKKISIKLLDIPDKVLVNVKLTGEKNTAEVLIKEKHDNIIYMKKNTEVILDKKNHNVEEAAVSTANATDLLVSLSIKELVQTVEGMDSNDLLFLLDGIKMNSLMAEKGLSEKLGSGVGYSYKMALEDGLLSDNVVTRAVTLTAAASDARMSGMKLPVMSSNGSGNHGLTAILPIAAYVEYFPQSEERVVKALAISHLVIAYIKHYTGRLSAVCGCGVAASVGSAAAITWLMDLGYEKIEGAINNMVADLSGVICDGAKAGCANKLASASHAAVQAALLAKYDGIVPNMNGIVGNTVEESIRNLGAIANDGMTITDKVIVHVMDEIHRNA